MIEFGTGVVVGDYAVLGYPKEARIKEAQQATVKSGHGLNIGPAPTYIGEQSYIASHVVVGEGTRIGNNVVIEDFCRLGFNCVVGDQTRIMYGAFICDRVTIGANSKISGFVCDGAEIGDDAAVMGQLVHEYTQPHITWGIEEPAPRIGARVVIAFNAVIVGGVTVGENSYVAAGAIVTKDVPSQSVVIGVNRIIPVEGWSGKKISPEFWTWKQS
jgi:acetyltransferase-like isoleucine patch superfamily enzyme